MTPTHDVFHYGTDLELVLQKEPVRLLYIKEKDEFVTHRYATYPEFKNESTSFFLEHSHTGTAVMYVNYTDEQADMLKSRLNKIVSLQPHVPDLHELIDAIEKDFLTRKEFRQEWESYSLANQTNLKTQWYHEILQEVAVEEQEKALVLIPFLIKKSWLKYSGLRKVWEDISDEYQDDIFSSWRSIVRASYKKSEGCSSI